MKENIADTYIFVRYMGPKFVIVFCGVESDAVADFINQVKDAAEKLQISLENNFEVMEILDNNKKDSEKIADEKPKR